VRLDHLLSKEHHETPAGPHIADHCDRGRIVKMGYTCSGCGSGARQTLSRNGIQLRLDFAVMESSDTLLGFETTSPSPLRPDLWETGGGLTASVGSALYVGVWLLSPRALVVGCGV
jgi:hypothetical protein